MGKLGNSICIVIIIILVIFLASGTTYLIMSNNESNHEEKEVNKDNEIENNENKQEEITFSEEELNEYLSYVPNINRQIAYNNKKTNVNSFDKKALTEMALLNNIDCWYQKTCDFDTSLKLKVNNASTFYYEGEYASIYFPLDYINSVLNYRYNFTLNNVEETKTLNDIYNAGLGFVYQNGYFLSTGGGSNGNRHLSIIDSYKTSKNELTIYEISAYYNQADTIKDYYNDYSIEVNNVDVDKYFENNKDKFTMYKHTFKNNKTGYYWYQTEVVEK